MYWIGIRPQHRKKLIEKESIDVSIQDGIIGDHYKGSNKKRQVTLIQAEHIVVLESLLKKKIKPEILRRNIVISGINLLAFKSERFQIGSCILEGTGQCHPCSRMEELLGQGGYHAMRGHGGITATVIGGGKINIGDSVKK